MCASGNSCERPVTCLPEKCLRVLVGYQGPDGLLFAGRVSTSAQPNLDPAVLVAALLRVVGSDSQVFPESRHKGRC